MNQCNVCDCDFDIEAEGGIDGHLGILPVSFCPTCYACMCDMADQASFREWEGLTDEEIALVCSECAASAHNWNDISFARAIEAKLKEKNT